jgi:hypothetical protein
MSYPQARHFGSTGEVTATYRRHGHDPELRNPGGGAVHYLATGASTGGEFGLYRWEMGVARRSPTRRAGRP